MPCHLLSWLRYLLPLLLCTVCTDGVPAAALNHTCADGQTAGFVFETENSSLLMPDVLKGFTLTPSLKGERRQVAGFIHKRLTTFR